MKTIDKESEEVTLIVSVRNLLRAAFFYTIASSVSFTQNKRTKTTYVLTHTYQSDYMGWKKSFIPL